MRNANSVERSLAYDIASYNEMYVYGLSQETQKACLVSAVNFYCPISRQLQIAAFRPQLKGSRLLKSLLKRKLQYKEILLKGRPELV